MKITGTSSYIKVKMYKKIDESTKEEIIKVVILKTSNSDFKIEFE